MKKLIPFSNATEADLWITRNCTVCKTKCHHKRNFDIGFISGEISQKTALFVGIKTQTETYCELNSLCQHKDKYVKAKKVSLKRETENCLF